MSNKNNPFTQQERLRYKRHIQLPSVGVEGQVKLKNSSVLIIGAGGLGSPVSLYLAAAGIGHITLVDGDIIDTTNLQRQILFTNNEVGESKAECGKRRLKALNPDIKVTSISSSLTLENGELLVNQADLVLDCTDNFATRYLINDLCAQYKKPWMFASIFQFSGQCALFVPNGPCFRCLFPDPPSNLPDCNSAGVLGVLAGMLGTFQANEALKLLIGLGTPLESTLMLVEAVELSFHKIKLVKHSNCIICYQKQSPKNLQKFYQQTCLTKVSDDRLIEGVEFNRLRSEKNYQVLDVRSLIERNAFNIGGTHIPIDELAERFDELDLTKQTLCYCQSGMRSLKACEILQKEGFSVKSLDKGLAG